MPQKQARVKETDIVYETKNGKAWILIDKKNACYIVFESGLTHSVSDSAYPLNDDGLSIAKVRANYLSNKDRLCRSKRHIGCKCGE